MYLKLESYVTECAHVNTSTSTTDKNNVMEGSFKDGDLHWFEGGKINACYNAVDRHLKLKGVVVNKNTTWPDPSY